MKSPPLWTRVQSSTDGICNTCVRPADSPFRYKTRSGETRGCIASCHDPYVAHNTRPNWMAARMVLPQWITRARRAIPHFERLYTGPGPIPRE